MGFFTGGSVIIDYGLENTNILARSDGYPN